MSALQKTRVLTRRLSWDELQTRVRQAVSKRIDYARYRAGLVRSDNGDVSPPAAGVFFFTANELPRLEFLLREHLSGEAEQIIREAEEICAHRFRLLGYASLDYGLEIDWHRDAAHGKRAPLLPWYKIPFLDFSAVGDHKVIWELNRHQHLVTLAKGWVLTRQEKYAAELVKQWYDWQKANPFPLGINWASALEVAFRSLSWLWVRFLMAGCPAVPENLERDLSRALALNGDYLERYLSTYFSPNTHLLGEATALFFIGTLYPRLRNAARWRSLGWSILLREANRQVNCDGVYFEQSLYYHVYALDFFLHARTLAARNGIKVPADFDARLDKMLNVLSALSRAGPPHGFGDDDGGRVFDSGRNRREHMTDPLATGAVLLGRKDLASTTSLTEEALWLFGEQAVSTFREARADPSLRSAAFKSSGLYVMASSQPTSQQMVIDAGPLGAGRAGHGHADALSLTVSFGGRQWLIDPGTFGYTLPGKERDRFRSTRAHNTLMVDGRDQAQTEGPFGWSFLPRVQAEHWVSGETFAIFSGSHTGYGRLPDPVLHRRWVFHLHDGFWLVRDLIEGQQRHACELSWHFASDLDVRDAGSAFVAVPARGNLRLALIPVQAADWSFSLASGEISPAYGIKETGPVIRMGGQVQLPSEYAIVLAPLMNGAEEAGTLSRIDSDLSVCTRIHGYRYDRQGESQHMIFSTSSGSWKLGSWASDATFIFCKIRDGELVQFILCDGSFADFSAKSVFARPQKIERFEWRASADGGQSFASDELALDSFSRDHLRSLDFAL